MNCLMDRLVYYKMVYLKKYDRFLSMMATWFRGLWFFWNLRHINAHYYSQNILDFMFLNNTYFCGLRLVLKKHSPSLSLKSQFPYSLHYESYYSFINTIPKALWKSQFSFLLKCETFLVKLFRIHSPHIHVWRNNFKLHSLLNSKLMY